MTMLIQLIKYDQTCSAKLGLTQNLGPATLLYPLTQHIKMKIHFY